MTDSSAAAGKPRFDRVEFAGALGDLGTLLPIVLAMILINKLSPSAVFLSFGLFYLVAGFYYKLPVLVQPLKAVGAIALANPAIITESVIGASGIIFGALLLLLAISGTVDRLAKLFTPPVVRGIQLSLGLIFLKKGIELIVQKNLFLAGTDGAFSGYRVNLIIGAIVFILVLALLDNKKLPAAIAALAVGVIAGAALGGFLASRVDYQQYAAANNGKMKVPTLRNVDKWASALGPQSKAYSHNGYFKSLWQIVHFYNTRDAKPPCVSAFTPVEDALAQGCWPVPEVPVNVNTKELGNLHLTRAQEDAIVAFMKTLSDGFMP